MGGQFIKSVNGSLFQVVIKVVLEYAQRQKNLQCLAMQVGFHIVNCKRKCKGKTDVGGNWYIYGQIRKFRYMVKYDMKIIIKI